MAETEPRGRKSNEATGISAQNVKAAMRIGMPMNAPAMPQRYDQKKTENKTTNGEIDKALPINLGSR